MKKSDGKSAQTTIRVSGPAAKARPVPRRDKASKFQDPHGLVDAIQARLEVAIGREVREFRKKLDMTVADLAKLADLSAGMLSKIENGMTSPSLDTLQALSRALHVPVTAFFRRYEEERDATFVPAGQGLTIERRGTRAGHQYQLLGHTLRKNIAVEPYLITLTEKSDVFPIFQHAGVLQDEGRRVVPKRYRAKTRVAGGVKRVPRGRQQHRGEAVG